MKTEKKPVGRPRRYESNATKQAAYRERLRRAKPEGHDGLAARLHATMKEAAQCGDGQAVALCGATAEETLKNLNSHFHSHIKWEWKPL